MCNKTHQFWKYLSILPHESGSSVDLNFNCRRLQNVFKQQSEGTDRNVTSVDELRSLVPNEELLNDFLSFLGGVEAQNEEDCSCKATE